MKTAISIPDHDFADAERAAKMMGVSRSEFFRLAARRMVRRVKSGGLTAKIDAVLSKAQGAKGLDRGLAKMQALALADEKW